MLYICLIKNKEMNIEKLKRTIELLKSIPDEKFNMKDFRKGENITTHECGTVGCIIGHATVLDTEENFNKHYFNHNGKVGIKFYDWSYEFYELNKNDKFDKNIWDYLFSSYWVSSSEVIQYDKGGKLGTKEHAIYRINLVIDGYIPSEIKSEIEGELVILQLKQK